MPEAAPQPFDISAASKALTLFAIEYVTLPQRFPPGTEPPVDVIADLARKTDEAIKAGLMCLGEVGRMRALMTEQRQIHLPMPSTAPGVAVVCQACSMDGAIVPWKCAVWNLADAFLADGK